MFKDKNKIKKNNNKGMRINYYFNEWYLTRRNTVKSSTLLIFINKEC